jgi:hypothetical protein
VQATKILPIDYQHRQTLDLSSSRVMLWLNIAAIPLLFFFGWLFYQAMIQVNTTNPFRNGLWGVFTAFVGWEIIALPISIILMLVFHEMVHGIFFWLFTRERPKFAFKGIYAYAAAPDWYLPKSQYVIVGLSPIIVISLFCILSSPFVSPSIIPYLFFIAIFNAAGALGDMLVVAWVLLLAGQLLIQDQGDKFLAFSPLKE